MFWYCVCGYGILVGESLGFWAIDRFRVELGAFGAFWAFGVLGAFETF